MHKGDSGASNSGSLLSAGDSGERKWNVLEVKRSDLDVFEALACDSFAVKRKDPLFDAANSLWTQEKPSGATGYYANECYNNII